MSSPTSKAWWHRWRTRAWAVLGSVSVRTKILGMVLALVLLLGFVVTLQVRVMLIRILRIQWEAQSYSVVRDVAARSTDLVLINDIYALNQLLRDTQAHNADVRYLFVQDSTGHVLAHTFDGGFPLDLLPAHPLPSVTDAHVQVLTTDEGMVWDAVAPIFDGRAGVVRVGLDEHRLWTMVNTVIGQIIMTMIVLSMIGLGAAIILTWLLTRPVLALVSATQRIGQGDYSPRVQRWANDELGTLSEAFNTMAAQLAQAEDERSERERLRQFYLQRVIQAQEEERRRIARELHDETGQALASSMVGLRMVETAESPENLHIRLHEVRSIVASTLERVRHLAFELRPSVLDDMGLVAALRRYTQDYQQRFGVCAELQVLGLDGLRLAAEVETTIYRIVQEAMTNAAKYASCTHLSVLLQARAHQFSVIVEDDGRGFDVQQVLTAEASESRLGLFGMHERAELIGGELKIESQIGGGTAIYLRLPLLPERNC